MKHFVATLLLMLLTRFSHGQEFRIIVEDFDRVISENAADLNGCRIQCTIPADHIIKTVGSPKQLGRFIANSMLESTLELILRILKQPLEQRQVTVYRSLMESLSTLTAELVSINRLHIKEFEETLKTLQRLLQERIDVLVNIKRTVANHDRQLTNKLLEETERLADDLNKLERNWNAYTRAIRSGSKFSLNLESRREGFLKLKRGRPIIKRIFGIGLLAVVGEYFFAEPVSAASLDDFAVEVTRDEYDAFYGAVKMERDRLLRAIEEAEANLE